MTPIEIPTNAITSNAKTTMEPATRIRNTSLETASILTKMDALINNNNDHYATYNKIFNRTQMAITMQMLKVSNDTTMAKLAE